MSSSRVRAPLHRVLSALSLLGVVGLVALAAPPSAGRAQIVELAPSDTVTFDRTVIQESSALVKSRRHRDVFWTLSDSGNEPELYALDRSGALRGRVRIDGVENRDWEDLAIDDEGRLYVGDIGNNASRRRDLAVYVVEEPELPATAGEVTTVELLRRILFRYPDQPQPPDGRPLNFDAESLYWVDGSLFLLTKHRDDTETKLYRFVENEGAEGRPPRLVDLELLGSFDVGGWAHPAWGSTSAADVSRDGRHLALLSYRAIFLFERLDDAPDFLSDPPVTTFTLRPGVVKQCEAIAWDGDDLVITNEQGEMHRFTDVLARGRRRAP